MTDKIQQARRAAFESSLETRNRQRAESGFDVLKPEEVRLMWWAFNAALDAVEIELPQLAASWYESEKQLKSATQAVEFCRTAIESTILGIKVK